MTNRRDLTVGALIGAAGLAVLGTAASAGIEIPETQALEALDPWADALFSGDPAQIEKVLAPEYQIMRSNGSGYDKAGYLKALPKQKARSKFSKIVATASGDVMVLRYMIETDQIIDGKPVEAVAPRLSVFRKDGGQWLMSAHANFSKIG